MGRRTCGLSLSAGAALAFLSLNNATGTDQAPCYRVVDLGTLGGITSEAFAINDFNNVVGQSRNGMNQLHAFFWNNEPMMDLGTLVGGAISIAYDINNSSEIVGQSDIGSLQHATYWQNVLAAPADLGTLYNFGNSTARGINDNSKIIGWSDTLIICPGTLEHGFRMDPAGPMKELFPAGGFDGIDNRHARPLAINTPGIGSDPVIAGSGALCENFGPAFCGEDPSDSIAWIDIMPNDLDEPGFGDGLGEARDVSDLGELVGWGRNMNASCDDRALFWENVATTAIDIHTAAGVPAEIKTEANALNEAREIVGQNTSQAHAYLWTENLGAWSFADLNDEISPDCQDGGTLPWELIDARDINENGWIVGLGSHPSPGNLRAFLLIPIDTCLWDITGPGGPPDGIVGINDLLALLGAWGPCPSSGICMADFNCTLDVGITDQLALLAHWGRCPTQSCPYVGGGESSGGSGGDDDGSGPSDDDVEDALEQLGYDDMEEFGAWMDSASEPERAAVIAVLAALLL